MAKGDLYLTLPKTASLEPEATSHFYEQALLLALEKTRQANEQIHIYYHSANVNRERSRLLVKQGVLDIIWSSSNKKREQELTPVKFNLIRGINEYRLLLIRADDQSRFDQVKTLADLQQFKIGSGIHWSDTEVYRFNGLPLVTSYAYESMFRMLGLRRFDYMARSIQEINYEIEQYGKLGLAIEKNLVIHYPQPIYFFVNNNNPALAKRIQQGLELAREDGSLDALFLSIPNFRQAWEQLQQLNRKMIELQTPE
ncbi:substrate-binding periplasmic protein [Cellvibrio sp. OA-2007]|uniref:substrate-binding periplasmic protein n=1 Tax=Cellvibrio sp. OA-2007 TaxID=529823 RepID=UPI000784E0D6|nr:transporter substrate-binding domain-containing protein [Cellvibrio sp. OA-2007]